MEFFSKLLKISRSSKSRSRSPTPDPPVTGPSSPVSTQNEAVKESTSIKERIKEDNKSKEDKNHQNHENSLRPSRETRKIQAAPSSIGVQEKHTSTVHVQENHMSSVHIQERHPHSPGNSPQSGLDVKHDHFSNEIFIQPRNPSPQIYDSSRVRPQLSSSHPELRVKQSREMTPNSPPSKDTMKIRSNSLEAEEAVNATKNNIEVLAYLKKSELNDRHKENIERVKLFLASNSTNNQSLSIKDTEFLTGDGQNLIAPSSHVAAGKNVTSSNVCASSFRSTSGSNISQNRNDLANSNSISNAHLVYPFSRDKSSFEIGKSYSSPAIPTTLRKLESFPFAKAGNSATDLPEVFNLSNCDFSSFDETAEQRSCRSLPPKNCVRSLSSRTKKLTRQSATNSFGDSDSDEEIEILGKCCPAESKKSTLNLGRDPKIKEQGQSDNMFGAENFDLKTQPKSNISTNAEIILDSSNMHPSITTASSFTSGSTQIIDSRKLIFDCNFEDTLGIKAVTPKSNDSGFCESTDSSKNIINDVYESSQSYAVHTSDTGQSGSLIFGTSPSNEPIEQKVSIKKADLANDICGAASTSRNTADIDSHSETSYTAGTYVESQLIEKAGPHKSILSDAEENAIDKGENSSFMNIYMKGEIGDSVKIEKIGDMFISDSSRKSSSQSLADELEGYARESDIDFESDSLEGSEEMSGSGSEDGFDFEIEFVDDIEERLKDNRSTVTPGDKIQESLGKLFNTLQYLDDDNEEDFVRHHETEIDIHAPAEYLTVQKPRTRKRSLRIRLSPVIELLDESVSPTILFDFGNKTFDDQTHRNKSAIVPYGDASVSRQNEDSFSEHSDSMSGSSIDNQWQNTTSSEAPSTLCSSGQFQIKIDPPSNSLDDEICFGIQGTSGISSNNFGEQIDTPEKDLTKEMSKVCVESSSREETDKKHESIKTEKLIEEESRKLVVMEQTNSVQSTIMDRANSELFPSSLSSSKATAAEDSERVLTNTRPEDFTDDFAHTVEGEECKAERAEVIGLAQNQNGCSSKVEPERPESLKELCEATIYADFENRNVESSNQENNVTSNENSSANFCDMMCYKEKDKNAEIRGRLEMRGNAVNAGRQDGSKQKSTELSRDLSNMSSKESCDKSDSDEILYHSRHNDEIELSKVIGERGSAKFTNETSPVPGEEPSGSHSDRVYDCPSRNDVPQVVASCSTSINYKGDEIFPEVPSSHNYNNETCVVEHQQDSMISDISWNFNTRKKQRKIEDKFTVTLVPESESFDIEDVQLDIPLLTATEWEQTRGGQLDTSDTVLNEPGRTSADSRIPDLIHRDLNPSPSCSKESGNNRIAFADNKMKINSSINSSHEGGKKSEQEVMLREDIMNQQPTEEILKLLRAKEDEVRALGERMKQKEEELQRLMDSKRHLENLLGHSGDKLSLVGTSTPGAQSGLPSTDSDKLKAVVREYEEIIAGLMEIVERDRNEFDKERQNLQKEITELISHLNSLELAFNDIHLKYEKSKIVIAGFKSNEDLLKQCIADMEMVIMNHEKRYNRLKEHATSELQRANEEVGAMRRDHEAKQASYNDLLKKCEVQLKSLQEIVNQKMEENTSLMRICDDLIQKVSDMNH
ncbi:unnamed protein product [Bemisia tabaci]|uniref:Transforming acidic coiled-coil-containing protein C-terminal domain-containing protein n=1 Tax=Bemisia tabaci TaxID=7038 RepID=A0A9P0CFM3_BEMTA|nr:unnamed protein product [Bemisia tabaci]